MPTHCVKIFGERNTGTRAMAALLRQLPGVGFRAGPRPPPAADAELEAAIEESMTGQWKRAYLHALRDDAAARACGADPWKHAAPCVTPAMRAAGAGLLVMVRDPYSWIVGLARRPYHLKGPRTDSLEAFVARPWMTERREGVPAVLRSPVDLWGLKLAAAFEARAAARAAGLCWTLVRFEDFVADPAGCAVRAAAALRLPDAPLAPAEGNTKAGEAGLATLGRYYAQEGWRDWLTREAVARINARLDPELLAQAGYAMRAPGEFPDALPDATRHRIAEEMASLRAPAHRAGARAG